jgi:hypothetical protein
VKCIVTIRLTCCLVRLAACAARTRTRALTRRDVAGISHLVQRIELSSRVRVVLLRWPRSSLVVFVFFVDNACASFFLVARQWLDNATQIYLYLESMLQEAGAGTFNVTPSRCLVARRWVAH